MTNPNKSRLVPFHNRQFKLGPQPSSRVLQQPTVSMARFVAIEERLGHIEELLEAILAAQPRSDKK